MNKILISVVTWAQTLIADVKKESGQDLLEYALLGGLIAAAIVALLALGVLSGALSTMATNIGNCIDFTSTSPCRPGF